MLKLNNSWDDLSFWKTGEFQVIEERLNDLYKRRRCVPANRSDLFAALKLATLEEVKVVIVGQDPYPNPEMATGVAFSIPKNIPPDRFPPTLRNIFHEYHDDLHYDEPRTGDLSLWCSRGVLLWNAYPSCERGKPGSHHWPEWEFLTKEILERLGDGKVFILLGRVAGKFVTKVSSGSRWIETSHPSQLGARYGFLGSRIFSRANGLLKELGKEPIDWRL